MNDKVKARYPNLCRLLEGSRFAADVDRAEGLCQDSCDPQRDLYDAHQAGRFKSSKLTYHTCCPCFTDYFEDIADGVEADLATLATRLPFGQLVAAYRDKLLNDDQFEDVVYEIASAATLEGIFDAGSLALETAVIGRKTNTDITGLLNGQRVRAEVTVVHDAWPPALERHFQEIMEQANVETGYTVVLGTGKVTEESATRVRDMIADLHRQSRQRPGEDLVSGGFSFLLCGEDYRCSDSGTPMTRLTFEEDPAVRLVALPAASRSMMDRHERDELANPPGVVDALAAGPDNHNDNPLSTRIWQRLNDKVQRQCEDGIVNLIVLGQPRPWNDNSVEDALHGASFAAVGFTEDEAGVRHALSASFRRTLSGPFRPWTDLPPDLPADDRERLTHLRASFSRLSAVVLFRLGGTRPHARVYTNPNAGVQLPAADVQRLEAAVLARAGRTRQAL